jgi:hypothetical protein
MDDTRELKEIKINLPVNLINLFEMQAKYTGRTFNAELINVLERAICLDPDDLDVIKAAGEAKADLDEIRHISMEEGTALLEKYRQYNRIVNELPMLNSTKQ